MSAGERVIVYIDGFNLYYGMRSKGWQRYYWLNVQRLAQHLLKPGQSLVGTKYFTSRVSSTPRDPEKNNRQSTYIEALGTVTNMDIYYGHYLEKTVECFSCGAKWQMPEEKMTDVNIAVELMVDTFQNRWDTALLISGDSDLTAPIQNIQGFFPAKRVVVAFPPDRHSVQLQRVAHAYFTIGRRKLAASQFPDSVRKADGFKLARPTEWR